MNMCAKNGPHPKSMVEKSFFGRVRHILVREIFQKSVREKYKISLDFTNILENYYSIIILFNRQQFGLLCKV